MAFAHHLTLGVELFEDRLVPATFIGHSSLPAVMATPGPVMVRGPEAGLETVSPVHQPAGGVGMTGFERDSRPIGYLVDTEKIVVPVATGGDFHPINLATRPAGFTPDGSSPSAPGGRVFDALGWGAWLPVSAWVVDLYRPNPEPPTPWRTDPPSPGAPPDTPFREEFAAWATTVLSSGPGLPFLVKLVHATEDGPFGGPEWVIPAGTPATAAGLSTTTTGSSFQVIPTSQELSASGRPWLVSGAGEAPDATGGPDSSDPGSAARLDQDRPVDPPPPDEATDPIEADVPGGSPVAGLLGLDTGRLEAGARQLLTYVSDLGAELSEELDAPPELAWLTTAVVLSGGAGYVLWANRSARRPGQRLADRSGFGTRVSGEEYDGAAG